MRFISVLALACTSACFEPADGQFLCTDDGPCPSGQHCVAGVCRASVGEDSGVDANVDAGRDSALDQGAPEDLGADSFTPPPDGALGEQCAPDRSGAAVDEDGDGNIDESGCEWFFGAPHFVEHVNHSEANFGIAFGDSPLRAYVPSQTSGGPILMMVRADPSRPFGGESESRPLNGTAIPGARLFTATVTGNELLLVAQSESGELVAFARPSREDAFERVEDLDLPTANAAHPTIRRDGLELFYTQTAPTREIRRLTRSARELPFAASSRVVANAGWPSLSQDGNELFFTRDGGAGTELRTRSPSGDFSNAGADFDLPGVEFVSPTYLPAQREMWLVASTLRPFAHRDFALFRVQVCRDGPCELEVSPPCPATEDLGPDGFSCYSRTDQMATIGGANTQCANLGEDWNLASVSSLGEHQHLATLAAGSSWIGFTRDILPGGASDARGWRWSSGEPPLYENWERLPTAAGSDRCASISSERWTPTVCSTPQTFICELRALPTWLP